MVVVSKQQIRIGLGISACAQLGPSNVADKYHFSALVDFCRTTHKALNTRPLGESQSSTASPVRFVQRPKLHPGGLRHASPTRNTSTFFVAVKVFDLLVVWDMYE